MILIILLFLWRTRTPALFRAAREQAGVATIVALFPPSR